MTIAKVVWNKSSLEADVDDMEEELERLAKQMIRMVAVDAIEWSKYSKPKGGVDTGAYITSFSFTTNKGGRPRGKSSHGRPRKQNAKEMGDIGLSQLLSDLAKVDLLNTTSLTLRNNSPHASEVEKHLLVMNKIEVKYGNGR